MIRVAIRDEERSPKTGRKKIRSKLSGDYLASQGILADAPLTKKRTRSLESRAETRQFLRRGGSGLAGLLSTAGRRMIILPQSNARHLAEQLAEARAPRGKNWAACTPS